MKKRLMIDVLKRDGDIFRLRNAEGVDYKFVNILEYIKEVYDLTIVDLAVVLETTRQTIYNSFSRSSDSLADRIKSKIAYVYEVKTFEEALELEKKVELAYHYDKPMLGKIRDGEFSITLQDRDYIKMKYENIYELSFEDQGGVSIYHVRLKKRYDFGKMWKRAIHEMNAKQLGIKTFNLRTIDSDRIEAILRSLINRTSVDYVEALLRTLNNKVDDESIKLINYLDDF